MTIFELGDQVRALVTTQGLVKGLEYRVIDVNERQTSFGNFVSYRVAGNDCGNPWVMNGHMLLERVKP